MKRIYNLKGNIIQNQAVVWKIFRFDGFKQEDFLPVDSFLYKFVKESPENVWWNFWSIWKKHVWNELEIIFENYYFKIRKWLRDTYNISEEKLEEFDRYYKTRKENIEWIVSNSLSEENYFWAFLPFLSWMQNNTKILIKYKQDIPKFIEKLETNINYKHFFGENIKEVSNVPVFPTSYSVQEKFKAKDFDVPESEEKIIEQFINDMYKYTIKELIWVKSEQISSKLEREINEEKAREIIFSFFKSLIPKRTAVWGKDVFYDNIIYRAFTDTYFYPMNSMYLKIFDVIFTTEFIWNEIITKSNIEIIQKVLREAVQNNLIDYFVIKTTILRKWMKINLAPRLSKWVYDYISDNWKKYRVSFSHPYEKEFIEKIWDHFNTRWIYWLTIWLYTKDPDNIYEVKMKILNEYWKENIRVMFDLFEKNDWFKENNYLSIWAPSNLQFSNFNWLYVYLFNNRVLPIKPAMYWWMDLKTNTPIFLNPFDDFIKWNRHIVLVWDSWVGKSILAQQMISTILQEKIIAIDPVWTFSNLSNIGFPIEKIDVLSDMDNPLYFDKEDEMYKRLWDKFNYQEFYKSKVEFLLKALQITFLEEEKQFEKLIKNMLIQLFKRRKWKMYLNALYKDLEKIFKLIRKWRKDKIYFWKEIHNTISDEKWLWKIWELLAWIENLNWTALYNILNKEKDFLAQIWNTPKMVFKIDWLNLAKIKSEAQTWKISDEGMIKIIHFEILLDWISQFFTLNKEYMDNVLFLDYEKKLKTYLFIDETHNLLEIDKLRIVLWNFIREIRNRYAGAFLLTQNITDFPKSMLKNIQIKMFLTYQDVVDYLSLMFWMSNEAGEDMSSLQDETNMIRVLKLYSKEYEKALDRHDWIESLWFYHYWKQVFLTKNKLSQYLLKNIKKLQT